MKVNGFAGVGVISLLFCATVAYCSPTPSPSPTPTPPSRISPGTAAGKLGLADSLFKRKQYTESKELYDTLFHNKYYTSSMLLKMAFIEEGLNHLGQSLYYLNLYFVNTRDPQALIKIEEIAARNKLEGYENSDATRFVIFLNDNHLTVVSVLGSICVLLFAALFYQRVRLRQKPVTTAVALCFFLALLFFQGLVHVNSQGIIAAPSTYIMKGPSAGSPVVAIVGEGHRLEILGKNDVWLRVKWMEEEVYVHENALLLLKL